MNATPKRRRVAKLPKRNSELEETIWQYLRLTQPEIGWEREWKFNPVRMFRFDFAVPERKIAVEADGLSIYGHNRHQSVVGYSKDCEKRALAALDGWLMIPITQVNWQSGDGAVWLDKVKTLLLSDA